MVDEAKGGKLYFWRSGRNPGAQKPRRARCMANQVGKRYQCAKCGTEMIVTKGGDGELHCCGEAMQQKQ